MQDDNPIKTSNDDSSAIGQLPVQSTSEPTINNISTKNSPDIAMQTGGMQNYLASQKAGDSNVVIPAGLAKRSVAGKIIAAVLGVVLLIGGVAAGVLLVQQQQEFREKASTDNLCEESPNCFVIDNPGNSGSFPISGIVFNVSLTTDQVHSFDPTIQEDGCYRVQIEDDHISWEKIGTDPECAEIVSIQVWTLDEQGGSTQKPTTEAICKNIIIYDTEWNQLSTSELSEMKSGDKVIFAVSGSTNQGNIDMAKFTVNKKEHEPTTTIRNETGEFYEEFVIPDGDGRFVVNAQLHHSELGWF